MAEVKEPLRTSTTNVQQTPISTSTLLVIVNCNIDVPFLLNVFGTRGRECTLFHYSVLSDMTLKIMNKTQRTSRNKHDRPFQSFRCVTSGDCNFLQENSNSSRHVNEDSQIQVCLHCCFLDHPESECL